MIDASLAKPGKPQTSKRWSLPNLLTYGRVVAVPLVVGFLMLPDLTWARWTAFIIFALAGISDFFDGYFARIWQQQSSMGRMLDPIADKLLVAACLMALAEIGTFNHWTIWAAIIILCREILVSGLREYLAELRVSLPVTRIAKWKTTAQILALGFLIVGPAGERVVPGTAQIGLVLLLVAAALTLYTGWDYMRAGFKHVADD
ncbi:MAG: CDP-diacylglycerol--glycerol-3-phosphate 3-phosphatidyltransferase [Hyphomicrobiales bacterium]|nr:CDP-diacylglycerol--glycerol-3-phosphate 3-phosphatidyltransferase [Hyphomicrobiales bacterium]MDE2113594.1 CDP-diacylglycerol--glycerol-3-phosphate 3-phosphatidyltransferase [Hyphomicrobiales bacterium]